MKISLGPIQYYWPKEVLLECYLQLADSPVDIVYLGETVCSKRRSLGFDDWMDIARTLTDAGKEVVLSTLTLIEAESELGSVKRIVNNGSFSVEANDFGAIQLAIEQQIPFTCGPAVNLYNLRAIEQLAKKGMKRWVMPVELSKENLRHILTDKSVPSFETEVFSYGRLPLAFSARCFTARAFNLPKDRCEFRCIDYPEGIPLYSQEQQSLFQINGIQTQSQSICNLLQEWQTMQLMGVDVMRISINGIEDLTIIEQLHKYTQQSKPMIPLQQKEQCNGYWFGETGISWSA